MQLKTDTHLFNGMLQDVVASKFPNLYLYDAYNLRITSRNNEALFGIINEKGPKKVQYIKDFEEINDGDYKFNYDDITIIGQYLGHCKLNEYIVVFTTNTNTENKPDYIYLITLNGLDRGALILYNGNLGFNLNYKITTTPSYESNDIQKVYWTDGLNLPRVINIARKYKEGLDSLFDFVPSLLLKEKVGIRKIFDVAGEFPSGVIQYAFTYYNKYLLESNIFYQSPLYYISPADRGASPEEMVNCAFEINVNNIDKNFDYLRVYSITRTSLNGLAICKRITDVNLLDISGDSVKYTDNNTHGTNIDEFELLYKGGNFISANTIEQKDGTLFLGGITLDNESNIRNVDLSSVNILDGFRDIIYRTKESEDNTYKYLNQLSIYDSNGNSTLCSTFKRGNHYRLGVLFLDKYGKWTDPIYIKDHLVNFIPQEDKLITINGKLNKETKENILKNGYIKLRPLVVFPDFCDKNVLYQGVLAPTVYTNNNRDISNNTENYKGSKIYALASWLFRPYPSNTPNGNKIDNINGFSEVTSNIRYYGDNEGTSSNSLSYCRRFEIYGNFKYENRFRVDWQKCLNFYSPDFENESSLGTFQFDDYSNSFRYIGYSLILLSFSDIDIITNTPTISSSGSGFIKKTESLIGFKSIISGLYYDDYAVDDYLADIADESKHALAFRENDALEYSFKYLVCMWQKSGSLNNDINRPEGYGVKSADLKLKIISNLRYGETKYLDLLNANPIYFKDAKPYNYVDSKIERLYGKYLYKGNVNSILNPDNKIGYIYAQNKDSESNFESDKISISSATDFPGTDNLIGNSFSSLSINKESVRMKYKQSPHIVLFSDKEEYQISPYTGSENDAPYWRIPIIEICLNIEENDLFGGNSSDALKKNIWIPCGEPVNLYEDVNEDGSVDFYYTYGDTYYQRWDCLKTYAYNDDDINQVVEIGSFMLETSENIDGRYDRNRGLISNLYASPLNFNLINRVYNLQNNFFSYQIRDEDLYKRLKFPNLFTWTKEKHSGDITDKWTNITLSSIHNVDGSKGKIVSFNTWKDLIYCFQENGISIILFNSRVLVPTSDGIPIELTNNYKVDGYVYISNNLGCEDKDLIKESPNGLYFIDNQSGNMHVIVGKDMKNLSISYNMSNWFIDNNINKLFYNEHDNDIYIQTGSLSLCFNESLNQFTSRYSYCRLNFMECYNKMSFILREGCLYLMFEGLYNMFFDKYKPYSLTVISNGNFLTDKVFTNIEFRADAWNEDGLLIDITNSEEIKIFDSLDVWNEYQSTSTSVNYLLDRESKMKRKFRIWRIEVPRAYYGLSPIFLDVEIDDIEIPDELASYVEQLVNLPINIKDTTKSRDRIRNGWAYFKLSSQSKNTNKIILHDLTIQYLE